MKILMLSPTLPWPPNRGSKIRIYYTLRELARAGHEITLVALSQEPAADGVKALQSHCAELRIAHDKNRAPAMAALRALFSNKTYRVAKFESAEFRKEIRQALRDNYDVLWVHFLETMAYLPEWAVIKNKPILLVVDQHNADELMWSRFAEHGALGVKLFAKWNLRKFRRFQRGVIHWIDVLLEVSQEETDFMRERIPSSIQIWTVPNGVDTDHFSPHRLEKREPIILFCGGLDRVRNIEAVKRVARGVFPIVKSAIPGAQFWVVGRNPAKEVLALQSEQVGIYVFANVEDVRPFYEMAKVAVAPIRLGGGTKLKIFEALAMGVPVVTVPNHGVDGASETYLRVGHTDQELAYHVLQLLEDEEQRVQAAREGLDFVKARYSWRAIIADVDARLRQFIQDKRR